ncbi:MAG: DMT family transporter [Clostridiales bacterium]|nr:DMT family transporter [Clostridiales bacterium]
MDRKKQGIALMLLSALSFSSMQVVVKLSSGTVPLMEQIFVRNVINLLLIFFLAKRSKVSLKAEKKYRFWLFIRSFFGYLGMIFLFYASANANQADVTVLHKMSPFLITILASVFLKEKLSRIQIPALIIAFSGAFVIANPQFNSNAFPILVAFLSATASSVSYTLLSYFKDKVNGLTVVWNFCLFSILGSIPFLINNFVLPTWKDLFMLFLIGVFGSASQLTLTYAYRLAPASEVSIYNYAGILFSMLLGYFILGQKVGIRSVVGGGIVILASFIVYIYNNKKDRIGVQEKCQEC